MKMLGAAIVVRVLGIASILSSVVSGVSVTKAVTTVLGVDPEGPARLNGGSFQQDAITTFRGWQYAAFYNATGTYAKHNVVISRRQLPNGAWQHARFTDYTQTTIDGHNIISIGISPGDGRIHLSYDHHDVPLNYRVSQAGVATNPSSYTWSTGLFGTTLHALPGAGSGPWTPLTYPRFERVSGNQLMMEFRIGQSGAGDSYLYLYNPSSGTWSLTGKYLQGANNNAYLNGLDFAPNQNRLHATWTWRETPDVVTNHDMMYVYSDDLGKTWKNTQGASIATAGSNPITPSSSGITVFSIPQNSGILNQEGQTVDGSGRVHVLNRESREGGFKWYHYWRDTNGVWTRNALNLSGVGTPTATGLRGKLATLANGDLIALLPNNDSGAAEIQLWGATPGASFKDWKLLWKQTGVDTEPLWDRYRIREVGDGVLSVFCRGSGGYPARRVMVVDFTLGA